MHTELTIEQRVQRGAEALDAFWAKHNPTPTWATEITEGINLYSSSECVLGQVFGTEDDPYGYWPGIAALQLDDGWADRTQMLSSTWAHGFSEPSHPDEDDALTDAWWAAIKQRLSAAVADTTSGGES